MDNAGVNNTDTEDDPATADNCEAAEPDGPPVMDAATGYPVMQLSFILSQIAPVMVIKQQAKTRKDQYRAKRIRSQFLQVQDVKLERCCAVMDSAGVPRFTKRGNLNEHAMADIKYELDIEEDEQRWMMVALKKKACYEGREEKLSRAPLFNVEEIPEHTGFARLHIIKAENTKAYKVELDGKIYLSAKEVASDFRRAVEDFRNYYDNKDKVSKTIIPFHYGSLEEYNKERKNKMIAKYTATRKEKAESGEVDESTKDSETNMEVESPPTDNKSEANNENTEKETKMTEGSKEIVNSPEEDMKTDDVVTEDLEQNQNKVVEDMETESAITGASTDKPVDRANETVEMEEDEASTTIPKDPEASTNEKPTLDSSNTSEGMEQTSNKTSQDAESTHKSSTEEAPAETSGSTDETEGVSTQNHSNKEDNPKPYNDTYPWDGGLDVAIAFPCFAWPDVASKWSDRERSSDWPDSSLRTGVKRPGCILIPTAHPASTHKEIEWQIYISVNELIVELSDVQKQCFVLLKIFRYQLDLPDFLTDFHLLYLLFWQCEKIPGSDWTPRQLGSCLHKCLDFLMECCEKSHFPHYFLNDINMFEDVDKDKLEALLDQIKKARNQAMDIFYSFSSENLTEYFPVKKDHKALFESFELCKNETSTQECIRKQKECLTSLREQLQEENRYLGILVAQDDLKTLEPTTQKTGKEFLESLILEAELLDTKIEMQRFLAEQFKTIDDYRELGCYLHTKLAVFEQAHKEPREPIDSEMAENLQNEAPDHSATLINTENMENDNPSAERNDTQNTENTTPETSTESADTGNMQNEDPEKISTKESSPNEKPEPCAEKTEPDTEQDKTIPVFVKKEKTPEEKLKESAIDAFRSSLKLKPSSYPVRVDYGFLLLRLQEYEQAIDTVDKVRITEVYDNSFGKSKRETVPKELQPWIDQEGEMTAKSSNFAQYILVRCFLETNQPDRAKAELRNMRRYLKKLQTKKEQEQGQEQEKEQPIASTYFLLAYSAKALKKINLAADTFTKLNENIPSVLARQEEMKYKAERAALKDDELDEISDVELDFKYRPKPSHDANKEKNEGEDKESEGNEDTTEAAAVAMDTTENVEQQNQAIEAFKVENEQAIKEGAFDDILERYKKMCAEVKVSKLPEDFFFDLADNHQEPVVVCQIFTFMLDKFPNMAILDSVYNYMGCMYQAQYEVSQGDDKLKLKEEARKAFLNSQQLKGHPGPDYVNFLYRIEEWEKAIAEADRVISVENEKNPEDWIKHCVSYDLIQSPNVDECLQMLIGLEGNVSLPAIIMAFYVLIQCCLKCDKKKEAEETTAQMQTACNKLAEVGAVGKPQLFSYMMLGYAAQDLPDIGLAQLAFSWVSTNDQQEDGILKACAENLATQLSQ